MAPSSQGPSNLTVGFCRLVRFMMTTGQVRDAHRSAAMSSKCLYDETVVTIQVRRGSPFGLSGCYRSGLSVVKPRSWPRSWENRVRTKCLAGISLPERYDAVCPPVTFDGGGSMGCINQLPPARHPAAPQPKGVIPLFANPFCPDLCLWSLVILKVSFRLSGLRQDCAHRPRLS